MSEYKCEKGKKQYEACKKFDADYCADCPHGIRQEHIMEYIEEEKAIGILHGLLVTTFNYSGYTENGVFWQHEVDFKRDNPFYANALEIVLKLLEKQHKEIEIQKSEVKLKQMVIDELVENETKNLIPKDAVREKIEELNKLIVENDKIIVECRKTIMENQLEKKCKIAKARMDNVMYYGMISYLKELLGE